MSVRCWVWVLLAAAGIVMSASSLASGRPAAAISRPATAASSGALVEVVDIDDTIDAGMAHRVARAVAAAQANGATAILVVLATNGGVVDDANDIRDSLGSAGIPTIAFIKERAWSAGALIALACDNIYMAPGSSIGAAEPIPSTAKTISAVRAEFVSLAEAHHRNTQIAAGMTDPDVIVPGLKAKGQIISLSPGQAMKYRFVDGMADSEIGALALAGYHQPHLAVAEATAGERIAQFAADPVVSGLLLTIGFLGLLIEMQTLHLIAGIIGVAALALFFGAHIVAGFSNWVLIVIFLLGVLALLFEFHVLPGHGISGLVGALLILTSIVLAFGAWYVGLVATALAMAASVALFFLAVRWLPESAFLRRLAFAGAQSVTEGYTTARPVLGLEGASGVAQTYLRPAGVADINGRRYQVQTDGDFIPAQTRIRVTRVEGATIFVTRA